MKYSKAIVVTCMALVACWVLMRRERFIDFRFVDDFTLKLKDTPATGAPGSLASWDNQLPTMYPIVPGFEGTMPPDSGVRTIKGPFGTCECPRPHPYDFRDIERDTVCVKVTGQAFSSRCAAKCFGYKDKDLYDCKPLLPLYRLG